MIFKSELLFNVMRINLLLIFCVQKKKNIMSVYSLQYNVNINSKDGICNYFKTSVPH